MNDLSLQSMTGLLTKPYRRGAETLVIPLGADVAGGTRISPYDFREYKARHGTDPPDPKYIIFPKKDIGRDGLELEIGYSLAAGGTENTVRLTIPPSTTAHTSFAIGLPPTADANLRLLRLQQLPIPLPGAGAANWGIIALLGNIAKLVWVLSGEKDSIRWHLQDVQHQRYRPFAHGFSLDKLGEDLRVPRFPPREHSFDSDTLALYHLNNTDGSVVDETTRFGLPGHPGTNQGAQSGVTGKFGKGFKFPGVSSSGALEIPTHVDFEIKSDRNFTVEAFVKADAIASPTVLIAKGQLDANGSLTATGWSLSLGSFRGIDNNLRWTVSDGTNRWEIFADLNIADGQFHHLAGVIDRTKQRSRLFVDGEERANAIISGLDAISNSQPIRIGRGSSGNQFSGVIDEVRLSKIARTDFHPVLGEGDEPYRKRLGIFERWLLPTPDTLLNTINSLVQINNQPDSFVLIEKDPPSAIASRIVRILPAALEAGKSIDRDGSFRSQEKGISGEVAKDINFDPMYLLRHDRSKVIYGTNENNRRMQAVIKRSLDALLDLLVATPGNLIIEKSFDTADTGLHRVGRALLLKHETLSLEQLGVAAHQAGFDFVINNGKQIYTSVAVGDNLAILTAPTTTLTGAVDAVTTTIQVAATSGFGVTPPFRIQIDYEVMVVTAMSATTWTVTRGADATLAAPHSNQAGVIYLPSPGIDVFVNKQLDLYFLPDSLPRSGVIQWTMIACGAGRVHPLELADLQRSRLRLIADAPGEITVRIEYTLNRHTVTGTRTIQIGIESLADGSALPSNDETAAVGKPEAAFNPIYLISHNVTGVNYGADPNNHKMQIALEKPLNQLLNILAGSVNGLQILKAYDPADAGLHKVGRALRLQHTTVNADRLGALCYQAGFGFVRHQGNEIYCAVAAAEKVEIAQAINPNQPVDDTNLKPLSTELTVGQSLVLRVRFSTLPSNGSYNWSLDNIGYGRGKFEFVLRPQEKFTPLEPGFLALNVTYLEPDLQSTFPYTFEIKLKDSLNKPETIIPKPQYDLIMNILNYFHPIGVEVQTQNIREHVVEVKGDLLNAFPGYTYPDFRF